MKKLRWGEKPLALSVIDVDAIRTAAERNSVKGVNHEKIKFHYPLLYQGEIEDLADVILTKKTTAVSPF